MATYQGHCFCGDVEIEVTERQRRGILPLQCVPLR